MPEVVAMLILAFQSIVDGLILGRLIRTNALATVNIVTPTYALMSAMTVIIGVGTQAQMSIFMDRKSYADAMSALKSGLITRYMSLRAASSVENSVRVLMTLRIARLSPSIELVV